MVGNFQQTINTTANATRFGLDNIIGGWRRHLWLVLTLEFHCWPSWQSQQIERDQNRNFKPHLWKLWRTRGDRSSWRISESTAMLSYCLFNISILRSVAKLVHDFRLVGESMRVFAKHFLLLSICLNSQKKSYTALGPFSNFHISHVVMLCSEMKKKVILE